jgi:membrane protease subunit (stomatin/prohibitin family)
MAGRSSGSGKAKEEAQNQEIAELQAQQAAQQAAPPPQTMDDKIAQLQQLSELKAAGVITEKEFAAQKAKIIGS